MTTRRVKTEREIQETTDGWHTTNSRETGNYKLGGNDPGSWKLKSINNGS